MPALIDPDQLRTFVAIAETGSFTRAAETVFKTQSAVSMQMKRLETLIGRSIFIRQGRSVKLTDDGAMLLEYARRIIALNVETLMAFSDCGLDGHLKLGTPDDFADRFLPEILARFARTHPKVEVTVICEPTPMLVDKIRNHDLDLALITFIEPRGPVDVVRREPLHWVTSARSCAHLCDVLPLALGRITCDWRMAAEQCLTEAAQPYRILYTSWNSMAVAAAVSAGLAVSVLPESAIRHDMRILGPSDGFPSLPSCKIGLLRDIDRASELVSALAEHIVGSLDTQGTLEAAE